MKEVSFQPTPEMATVLPEALIHRFDGKHLPAASGEAIRLTTVDQDGWPRAAMLSAGEILVVDPTHLRFSIHPNTGTTANVERVGRLTFSLVHDGALWEIRLSAKRLGSQDVGHNTAIFAATVESIRVHRVPYADVDAGVTYSLKDAAPVIARWTKQIEALGAAG